MTRDEWVVISASFENWFKGEWDAAKRDDYFMALKRLPRDECIAGCLKLMEGGQVFLPTPGEILTAAQEMVDDPVPSWTEAFDLLIKAVKVGGRFYHDSSQAKQEKAVAWLDARSGIVARFFEVETYQRLATTPFFDDDWGNKRRSELESRWNEFAEVAVERLAQGLALEAAGQRSQIEGPHRLDTAALLERLRPEQAQLEAGD